LPPVPISWIARSYLPQIQEHRRQTESDLWRAFEKARARISGAVFDALVEALRNEPGVQLDLLRMADFTRWAAAAESAFPCPPGTFLSAYKANRGEANQLVLEASIVATALIQFMEERERWVGTFAELLLALDTQATDASKKAKSWPRSPRALSADVRRVTPNLRALGLDIDIIRESHTRRRLVVIEKRS